jgi:hypothetical protein
MVLAQSAEEAGIDLALFPWKTSMWIYEQYLSVAYGYGSESVYYYPFDGKWLVTTLTGSDISKVLEYAKGGSPEFKIETA